MSFITKSKVLTTAKMTVEYAGKLCLAPMVRSGELPTRLMALKYGADLVWTPEIIDKKIIQCEKVDNVKLETIDFVEKKSRKPVLRTYPKVEKGKLIFQLGSANPDLAVEAALKVIDTVDGIDLNCGCPKPFSTHSGMGAALLSTPDLLELILLNLVNKVGNAYNKPISCKIRLLDDNDPELSLKLIDRLCKTGIANLTLHCRTRSMRNREPPIKIFLPEIISLVRSHGVSFVINGAIQTRKEFEELKKKYGNFVGGMIAESAEANPTVFSNTPLTFNKVIPEFIAIAQKFDNNPSNTKYIVLNQLPGKSKFYKRFCQVKSHEDLLKVANEISDDGNKILVKYLQKDRLIDPQDIQSMSFLDEFSDNDNEKKRKLQDTSDISDSIEGKKLCSQIEC